MGCLSVRMWGAGSVTVGGDYVVWLLGGGGGDGRRKGDGLDSGREGKMETTASLLVPELCGVFYRNNAGIVRTFRELDRYDS